MKKSRLLSVQLYTEGQMRALYNFHLLHGGYQFHSGAKLMVSKMDMLRLSYWYNMNIPFNSVPVNRTA